MNGRRIFAAVTIGHLGIDIFNSMGPVLLAFLKEPLALTNAQVGLAVGLYQLLAGTTQPAFGWVVDRTGSRFLGPMSVAVNLVCIGLSIAAAAATGSFLLFLLPFALAAVASGAFHPLGVMHASTVDAARSATFTAVFFFCGQLGLAIGPYLAGVALDRAGLDGIYWLLLIVAPVPLFMAFAMGPRRLHAPHPAPEQERVADPAAGRRRPLRAGVVAVLALVFASRSWAVFGTIAFLPLLLAQQGYSSSAQGLASGLFMVGGAVAAVAAGAWADRWGRRPVVFLTTFLGSLLLALLPGSGSWAFAVVLPCGALLGAAHSVLIVMAQTVLPWRRGLASGTALGFLFAAGAVATWAIGQLADRYELELVLQAGALVGLVSAVSSLLLPRREQAPLAPLPAVSAVLVLALIGGMFLQARPAAAGLNGEINGQVRDAASDAPLAGAEVRITGDQLHSTQVVRAGSGGSFRAPGLPPGAYYVEVAMDGYATSVVENLILVAGGVLRVDFRMRLGSASALDLVSSPLLDVVTGSDGNVLAGADLRQLPGAVAAHNLDLASGLDALAGDVAVNGWPPGFARYRIDGQESALREPAATAIDPRWVDQVRVWTMELAAGMAGPHIDLVTRSGGTDWRIDGGWSAVEPFDSGQRLALRLFDVGAPPAGGRDRRRIEGDEATVLAGGPLRDKRVRAFGGYSRHRARGTENLSGAGAPMTWDETTEQSVGKLDWWAGSTSNLTLKHHSGVGQLDGRRPALLVLPSVDGDESRRSRRQTTSLNIEWGVAGRVWLRVFGGRSDAIEDGALWQDAGRYFAAPHAGRAAGWFEAQPTSGLRWAAGRRNWAVEPSFFFFDHTLEIGFQSSRGGLDLVRSDPSDRLLELPGGPRDVWRGEALGAVRLGQEKRALYVQDAWRVGGAFKRRLTLHAGLRAEEEVAGPLDFGFEDRTEPRLAFVWDVAGQGRWKVFGGAAWWHVDGLRPREDASDVDAVRVLHAAGGLRGASLEFVRAAVDPDLRPARVREIQLGTGYQFLPDVAISARVAGRRLRDGIRLMPLFLDGGVAPTLLTPGRGAGRTPWGPDGGELPRLEQDWWGAELNANVGFSPSWRIRFSYLLSRLTGNHEAGGLGLEPGSLPGGHPALAALDLCSSPVPCDVFDLTEGGRRLDLDREHQLSGWLVLTPGARWLMALVYRFRTGAAHVPRTLAVRVGEGNRIVSTGLVPLPPGPDDPARSADLKRADLSLTYRVPLRSDDRRLSLFAEALNVFDQDAANRLWPLAYLDPVLIGSGQSDVLAAAAAQDARPDLRKALPAAFQTSRRVRAGLRFRF